ncbi:UNVERIFIED_CONTAM: Non-ribosomal peptide synthetase modules and related proteins [Acetivibrio alkalicellulosi]
MLSKRFEDQARKTPDKFALITEDLSCTYGQLNKRANQIADEILYVRSKNNIENRFVALFFEHGGDMIAGMLGVLKAGMSYVPIDPGYPFKRAEYILNNSGAKILLTNHNSINMVNQFMEKKVLILSIG